MYKKVGPSGSSNKPDTTNSSINPRKKRDLKKKGRQSDGSDEDDHDEIAKKRWKKIQPFSAVRVILPHTVEEQNRKTHGTWQRQIDFTRTLIGYVLGLYNFFRFPFLCYKFGGIFILAYIVMLILVGAPIAFLELTIGQYYGVNSFVAFSHMMPVLSGVSKALTWSCILHCWKVTSILAWLRVYASDSTSCLKGWEICHHRHYYNTPHCFTGIADDDCNDPSLANGKVYYNQYNESVIMSTPMLFYNFKCRTLKYYCESHGWEANYSRACCFDKDGVEHGIYERRYHAAQEFFYGKVLGMQRKMELVRKRRLKEEIEAVSGKSLTEIGNELPTIRTLVKNGKPRKTTDNEVMRTFLVTLEKSENEAQQKQFETIMDNLGSQTYQKEYWVEGGDHFVVNLESLSGKELTQLSMTTWIMITVFLLEDLLKMSLVSYAVNGFPFIVLTYMTYIATTFDHAGKGIEKLLTFRESGDKLSQIFNPDMWKEAVIQVIYTSGIGSGVLISLATFNNPNHNYLNDIMWAYGLSVVTSFCGCLISFCTIGHYITAHNIKISFWSYVMSMSTTASSIEFSFITFSHFLTLISDRSVTTFLFFFIFTSFASDTSIRLVQNVIDAVVAIAPRLKHHSTMVLICICILGYLIEVPVLYNGGFFFYNDLEYFISTIMLPSIVIIEVGATVFIYRASRIVDHAEQMNTFRTLWFRRLLVVSLYLSFTVLMLTFVYSIATHNVHRFIGRKYRVTTEICLWIVSASPLFTAVVSVIQQLLIVPRNRWQRLVAPLVGKDRNLRRAFIRRMKGEVRAESNEEDLRQIAAHWRTIESRLIMEMMAKRREEMEQQKQEGAAGRGKVEKGKGTAHNPLLASVVRLANAAKKAEEDEDLPLLEDDEDHDDDDDDEEDADGKSRAPAKRGAFLHVKRGNFFSKLKSAFLGKAVRHGNTYRPKRHVGGHGVTKIVTRMSMSGTKLLQVEGEEGEDLHSDDSQSTHEDEKKPLTEKYLTWMDYIERWPGRLDESDIDSEGSSIGESTDSEIEETYY